MTKIAASEARTHFSALLRRVAAGHHITITRRGVPVAELVPSRHQPKRPIAETVAALREFGRTKRLDGLSLADLRRSGSRPSD